MTLATRDQLRLLIGDVVTGDQILSDDQLDYLLGLHDDDARATAADAANAAANVLTMLAVDQATGAMSMTLSRRAELYRQRAFDLGGAVTTGTTGMPFAGGVGSGASTTPTAENATDPLFKDDLHDIGSSSDTDLISEDQS